ncbi:MAG: sugar ABC transporter substrate-binding protein, partial [Clostridia bacterium]
MKKLLSLVLVVVLMLSLCSFAIAEEPVTIEFIQWWEPELPEGFFRSLMDEFEAQNPNIKVELISGPYSSTKDQIVAGAATGMLCDVVGLDGAWVNDLAKQGAITNLDALVASGDIDDSQVAAKVPVNGNNYMYGVVTFAYTMFCNNGLLKDAGIEKVPGNRTEFMAAAEKLTKPDANQYGWVLPLSLQSPNGIQNDVMSWVWASGASMMNPDGTPNVNNAEVVDAVTYLKELYDKGVVSPGTFSKQEQDKVEEFVNGRVAMMVDTLAHITMIRERNADLDFTVTAVPAKDGYEGSRGMVYAAWGVGVSENTQHKAEAAKL